MRITYVPVSEKEWSRQIGGFKGLRYQRGSGLGSVFRSLFRVLLPVAKTAGKAVGRQALKAGADIATDIIAGENVKESARKHGRKATAALLNKAATKMSGGKRIKRKTKSSKHTVKKTRQIRTQLGVIRV